MYISRKNNFKKIEKEVKIDHFKNVILKKGKLLVSVALLSLLASYYADIQLTKKNISAFNGVPARAVDSPTRGDIPLDLRRPIITEPVSEIKPVEDIHVTIANRIKNEKFTKTAFHTNHETFTISADLRKRMDDLVRNHNVNNSFYVVTLDGKLSFGYNIDHVRFAACVSKAAYAMYCFKEIEKGNGSLNEKMAYRERHRHGGSGTVQNSRFGTEYTLEQLIYLSLHISDNAAYIMLQERFPHAGYNEMLRNLGCKAMLFGKGFKFGSITSREVAIVWNEIMKYSKESIMGAKLFTMLENAKYNYIKDAILAVTKQEERSKIKVAHKSGWTPTIRNDAGIVLGETPYIIVVITPNDRVFFNKAVQYSNEIIKEYTRYLNNKRSLNQNENTETAKVLIRKL